MTSTTTDRNWPSPLVPFSLEIEVMDRMVNFEIADDPIYSGFEIQAFDDPHHGQGMVVLLARRPDDRLDVYYQPGLRLDPKKYEIGGGLAAWVESDFEVARVTVSSEGVEAEVRFTDADGRLIEVRVGDKSHRRRMASLLAPAGTAITDPKSMLLFWMTRFDLLRRTGRRPLIRIDGHEATPGRLPAEWLIRRRLIKAAAELVTVAVNPAVEDPIVLTTDAASGKIHSGPDGIQTVTATEAKHQAVLRFDPPFPDLTATVSGGSMEGDWEIEIDATPIVAGTWSGSRNNDQIRLRFDVTEGWHPKDLPLLMKIVTRVVSVFRTWPLTYRWNATVTLGDKPTMVSRWERTGTERGESYRTLTGTK